MSEVLVLRDGRVVDPASGHDGVADVVVVGDSIAAVGPDVGQAHPDAAHPDATALDVPVPA